MVSPLPKRVQGDKQQYTMNIQNVKSKYSSDVVAVVDAIVIRDVLTSVVFE